jgi:hypothetical protein
LLEELTESGFITCYAPFDKTVKDSVYRLTDEYSQFYIKFIEGNKISGKGALGQILCRFFVEKLERICIRKRLYET